MNLPPELRFLKASLERMKGRSTHASWLLSDFESPVWEYSFGFKTKKALDWQITLDNETKLTDYRNMELLNGLKYFLIMCVEDQSTMLKVRNSQRSGWRIFHRACHVIDLLLIKHRRYKLSKHGLAGLSAGNLIELLTTLASHSGSAEAVYDWRDHLKSLCTETLLKSDPYEIDALLVKNPELNVITEDQLHDDLLGFPTDLIPRIRAALYSKGLYKKNNAQKVRAINTRKIANLVYANTIYGKEQLKPNFSILSYSISGPILATEYKAAPVTTKKHETIGLNSLASYRALIYKMGMLHDIPVAAPRVEDLLTVYNYNVPASTFGRFCAPPSKALFTLLRQAIELHLNYGKEIVNAYCRVVLTCQKENISPSELTPHRLAKILGEKLLRLGCHRLKTPPPCSQKGGNPFEDLRRHPGLLNLMIIYIGCIQLTIGLLSARRTSELYILHSDECMDPTEEWLMFAAAKSTYGLLGLRAKEARPIDPIAVNMMKNLVRMQKILKRVGWINKLQTLFSTPHLSHINLLQECTEERYRRNLNTICDYFQTPLNRSGERYYIRQHQLRRFFALLFFYSGSFSKLDTLQWMLAHRDPAHVYRYITDSIDGAVLDDAKAQYLAEQLHVGRADNYKELSELLHEHCKISDFSLIDTNDLEDTIRELMQEKWIEIEPEFFTDQTGAHFRIVVRLVRETH